MTEIRMLLFNSSGHSLPLFRFQEVSLLKNENEDKYHISRPEFKAGVYTPEYKSFKHVKNKMCFDVKRQTLHAGTL
jgi:hypothetical protein